ncbi:MAG: hypothetical protein GWO23_02215 [Gammaproteobacteria bacterium]|nr:hypothetical protein [Gammaproteobacteria bacterium]NIS49639.1 hypothetical protein [Phycisphaerae bacterium]
MTTHQDTVYAPAFTGTTFTATTVTADTVAGTAWTNGGTTFYPVMVDVTAVDASAGGSAQTTTCTAVPAGSIILNVIGVVTATFDGDTTTTIEVGVEGNTDKYIDPSDLDPAGTNQLDIIAGTNQDQKGMEYCTATTTLICTWTNTASASAGAASIYVVYADVS